MTDTKQQEDEQWLAALAGNPDTKADPINNREAAALRKALQQRQENLDALVPKADDALYQQMQFRLRRERLFDPNASDTGLESVRFSRQPTDVVTSSSGMKKKKSFRPAYWGLAASLVLGTVLVLKSGLLDRSDTELAVRGDQYATVMIVQDPQSRAQELIEGLKAVGAEPMIEKQQFGRIKIIVKSSNAVTDYLMMERIMPTIKNDQIILILDPTSK